MMPIIGGQIELKKPSPWHGNGWYENVDIILDPRIREDGTEWLWNKDDRRKSVDFEKETRKSKIGEFFLDSRRSNVENRSIQEVCEDSETLLRRRLSFADELLEAISAKRQGKGSILVVNI